MIEVVFDATAFWMALELFLGVWGVLFIVDVIITVFKHVASGG